MKNGQNSWVSEYRRKKFLERTKPVKKEISLDYLDTSVLKIPTMITVMLDLDGTVDYLDDERALKFSRRLDYIRKKFEADTAFISISTHYQDCVKIKSELSILERNLLPNIKIGMSFYYGGMYEYETNKDIPCGFLFNSDKVKTFDTYYRSTVGLCNKWIAVIDDSMEEDIYLRYQDNQPMLLGIPSSDEGTVSKNNFMRRASIKRGFDGVLEILDGYLEDIQPLSAQQILHTQRNMMMHLSSYELVEKIRKRDYTFLERYFAEGYADEDDYQDTLSWILLTNRDSNLSRGEAVSIERIINLLAKHFEERKDESAIRRAYQLQKRFDIKVKWE